MHLISTFSELKWIVHISPILRTISWLRWLWSHLFDTSITTVYVEQWSHSSMATLAKSIWCFYQCVHTAPSLPLPFPKPIKISCGNASVWKDLFIVLPHNILDLRYCIAILAKCPRKKGHPGFILCETTVAILGTAWELPPPKKKLFGGWERGAGQVTHSGVGQYALHTPVLHTEWL